MGRSEAFALSGSVGRVVAASDPQATSLFTPPPPAASPPLTSVATLWDGIMGVAGLGNAAGPNGYFNKGALISWNHDGGDYTDTTGTEYGGVAGGGTPYTANFTHNTVDWMSIPILSLAQHLKTTGKRGIYLRTSGGGKVFTRQSTTPPTITINSVTYPCLAFAVINRASTVPMQGTEYSVALAFLFEFDSSAWPSAITSAVLNLYHSVVAGGLLTINAFATRTPRIFVGGTPTLGIAQNYAKDVGIMANPNVFFSVRDFSDTDSDHLLDAARLNNPVRTIDTELGVGAVRFEHVYPSDTQGVSAYTTSWKMNHMWSSKRVATRTLMNPSNGLPLCVTTPVSQYVSGLHAGTPEELYMRLYFKFGAGFQCIRDGKKLPGLSGRYGIWGNTGIWTDAGGTSYTPHGGNGQNPSDGLYTLDCDNTGLPGIQGFSVRHHAESANASVNDNFPDDPTNPNPYFHRIPLSYYMYVPGGAAGAGDLHRWGDPNLGYVLAEEDRWYCFEHYVKMNTIDLTNPDAQGNGTGNADGIVRGWMDGVMVFEKTDFVLRHHPAIKVDEVMFDFTHGGTSIIDAPHQMHMSSLVVSKSYVGPMVPAWLAGKPTNQWIPINDVAVNGTKLSTMSNMDYAVTAGFATSLGGNVFGQANNPLTGDVMGRPRKGIFEYSGGSLKTAGNTLLIFGGGGAGSWPGNEVLGLRLNDDAPVWAPLTIPTPADQIPAKANGQTYWYLNGDPTSRHSYYTPQYVEGLDTLFCTAASACWTTDSGNDPSVISINLASGAKSPQGMYQSPPQVSNAHSPGCAKHQLTEQIYLCGGSLLMVFDPFTGSWNPVGSTWGSIHSGDVGKGAIAIDHSRNVMLYIPWSPYTQLMWTINLETGARTQATLSGPFAANVSSDAFGTTGGPSLIYDAGIDRWLLFLDDDFGGGSLGFYTIAYNSASSLTIDRLTVAGTPPGAPGDSGRASRGDAPSPGVWSRMQYVPALRGVVIAYAYNKAVHFVRTS